MGLYRSLSKIHRTNPSINQRLQLPQRRHLHHQYCLQGVVHNVFQPSAPRHALVADAILLAVHYLFRFTLFFPFRLATPIHSRSTTGSASTWLHPSLLVSPPAPPPAAALFTGALATFVPFLKYPRTFDHRVHHDHGHSRGKGQVRAHTFLDRGRKGIFFLRPPSCR